MKILRNKTYQGMIDEKVKLERIIYDLSNDIDRQQIIAYNDSREIQKLNVLVKQLKKEKHKLQGAKGGYVKEINKLKKQVEELDFKLKESMTDKYLVKKIKPGRTPKGPQMKLKDCSRISNISRKVFGN